MLEVLIYLFENYFGDNLAIGDDSAQLTDELTSAGFLPNEISEAFIWLTGLSDKAGSVKVYAEPHATSMRVLTDVERTKLGTIGYGLIFHLEHHGVLSPLLRELFIAKAMTLETESLDIEQLRWVSSLILSSDQPSQEQISLPEPTFSYMPEPETLH